MDWVEWTDADAASGIRQPRSTDDKYSRGVLGVVTGSPRYPGAAVLSVEAAARTGVGMIRFLGAPHALDEVLRRRPEAVGAPGRVQAWLLGSGMDSSEIARRRRRLREAFASGLPVVVDAGALTRLAPDTDRSRLIVTPHAGELARMLGVAGISVSADEIRADPGRWATRAAEAIGATVLLKGSITHVASATGERLRVSGAPAWLATAGAGDVLAGIIGALAAGADARERFPAAHIAASGALVHARAASLASQGGPITALDVAEAVPSAVRQILGADKPDRDGVTRATGRSEGEEPQPAAGR